MIDHGARVDAREAERLTAVLREQSTLLTGESLKALLTDGATRVAVTTVRILTFSEEPFFVFQNVIGSRIEAADIKKGMMSAKVAIRKSDGSILELRSVPKADMVLFDGQLTALRQRVSDPENQELVQMAEQAADAEEARRQTLRDGRRNLRAIGKPLGDFQWGLLVGATSELPEYTVQLEGGALAVFSDRVIVLPGGIFSMFAGGALATPTAAQLLYRDIVGIQHRTDLAGGALEFAHPDYPKLEPTGTEEEQQKVVTRAANALRMGRMEGFALAAEIDELRQRVAQSKESAEPDPAPAPSNSSPNLVEEIERLGSMHRDGLLDADEFRAAKQAVIARFT